jgi:low affinity Fe/Cu permease
MTAGPLRYRRDLPGHDMTELGKFESNDREPRDRRAANQLPGAGDLEASARQHGALRLTRRGSGNLTGVRWLRTLAGNVPRVVGSPWAFLAAIVLVGGWVGWGFGAQWSNTWLLWPSAIASVVTFLIAFSLQYTQNRDTRAMQLKLDEILRATDGARTTMIKLEELSDAELDEIERELATLRKQPAKEDAGD